MVDASTVVGDASIPQHDTIAPRADSSPRHGELVEPPACGDEERGLVREIRLFHARVIEAVEAAVEPIVEGIAADVLARELLLAPADVEAIVDRALQRFVSEEPIRVRVHPDDAPNVQCGAPVVADSGLQRGDAVIDLRNGSLDASLAVRLAVLLGAER